MTNRVLEQYMSIISEDSVSTKFNIFLCLTGQCYRYVELFIWNDMVSNNGSTGIDTIAETQGVRRGCQMILYYCMVVFLRSPHQKLGVLVSWTPLRVYP